MSKEGSFKPLIIVTIFSILVGLFWDSVPFIKSSIHAVLNPTAGWLLNYNLNVGMTIIIFVLTLMTTLAQKYLTDQKALKELKEEMKKNQEDTKKYAEHPEKLLELRKSQGDFFKRSLKLTSRSLMFTGIPFILLFRWFNDFFIALGNPKFFGVFTWFWFYFIASMVLSSILRKMMKVV